MRQNDIRYSQMDDTPLGPVLMVLRDGALAGLYLGEHRHEKMVGERDDEAFGEVRRQLEAYFSGQLRTFSLRLDGAGTDFQRAVWKALCDIPYGETINYGELAKRIGNPRASRAVGLANGKNPISIIVPCHRVIGANGSLTGYSGGIERKRWLLEHETRQRKLL